MNFEKIMMKAIPAICVGGLLFALCFLIYLGVWAVWLTPSTDPIVLFQDQDGYRVTSFYHAGRAHYYVTPLTGRMIEAIPTGSKGDH